jgi:rRNA maturation endonuclease Nob1
MREKNAKRCPRCGSKHIVPIEYGYPSREMFEDARYGRIVLGGCLVTPDSPDHLCDSCGHEWRDAQEVLDRG